MLLASRFDRQAYRQLSSGQLDDLPYGVIVTDRYGTIVEFNRTESRAVGIPRDRVLGRNFFEDIAPCTKVRDFQGRFADFVAGNRTSVEAFEFSFSFPAVTQCVTILFVRDPDAMERISIIVLRRAERTALEKVPAVERHHDLTPLEQLS